MKKLLLAVAAVALVSAVPAWAGQPVTITNAANTVAAPVDSTGLHVVCSSGCVAGGGSVVTSPYEATSTDASGTITLGGTYQTVFALSATRKGCLIQNPTTATEILNVKVGTMSAPFTIPIGGSFNCASGGGVVVTDAITATAATTAHAFSAASQQ